MITGKDETRKRALAHIEKISNIRPIEGADRIEQAYVLGWNLIISKGEFKDGDKCVYIEIDSKVPSDDERFAFLEKRKFKVKTMKFKRLNTISQGLALPLDEFPEFKDLDEGTDVTNLLRIKKIYDEDAELAKQAEFMRLAQWRSAQLKHPKFIKSKFVKKLVRKWPKLKYIFGKLFGGKKSVYKKFPEWIVKTDEERVENIPYILNYKKPLIVTEKIDGTSTTFALRKEGPKEDIVIASRAVRQEDDEQSCFFERNVYFDIFKKYNVEEKLKDLLKYINTADDLVEYTRSQKINLIILQGETYGDKIQGNPYNLHAGEIDFRAYNLIIGFTEGTAGYKWVLDNNEFDGTGSLTSRVKYKKVGDTLQVKINSVLAKKVIEDIMGIRWVPILSINHILPDTMSEMKEQATDKSVLNPNSLREGLVYRSETDNVSFKNVSNDYLISRGQ